MNDQPNNDLRTEYVNQTQILGGVYDFTLEFGQIEPAAQQAKIRHVAKIQMSPQHTKVLALMLLKHIAAYEHSVGVIDLPQELLDNLKLSNLQHFVSQVNLNE
ncbi:MAG: DUF3467 domain-containing protein [Herpetosiphon sp.]|nr:DUF3467 domain-containing protein [Herpetosiphon sp.]